MSNENHTSILIPAQVIFFSLEVNSQEYKDLCQAMKEKGRKVFRAWSGNVYKDVQELSKMERYLTGLDLELETKHLFSNQWNTTECHGYPTGLRVHDWYERHDPDYKNKHRTSGYYLEYDDEVVKNLRDTTFECSYCGTKYKQTELGEQIFCTSCLGSEYLKEENYPLLRLRPVSSKRESFTELTQAEKDTLTSLVEKAQAERIAKENAKDVERMLQERDLKIIAAQKEYEGKLWLMEKGISLRKVYFYERKMSFSYGGYNGVSPEEKERILPLLQGFPYKMEMKLTTGEEITL